MRFKKKKGGTVLFDSDKKAAEVRRNSREGVARAVMPRIRAIDLWLERDMPRSTSSCCNNFSAN